MSTHARRGPIRLFIAHLEQRQSQANDAVDASFSSPRGTILIRIATASLLVVGVCALALCVAVGLGTLSRTTVAPLLATMSAALLAGTIAVHRLLRLPATSPSSDQSEPS